MPQVIPLIVAYATTSTVLTTLVTFAVPCIYPCYQRHKVPIINLVPNARDERDELGAAP